MIATLSIDSRHQLIMFTTQGRLLGCIANVASAPPQLNSSK
jgi:hypothetical protein